MQKLAHDLRLTLSPCYDALLATLTRLLRSRISTDALTVLLATFSALFKHILVTSNEVELLFQTWNSLRNVLPACKSEVQRAFAEVWGSSLRRFEVGLRATAVEVMCASLVGIEDACAWSIVFACRVGCLRLSIYFRLTYLSTVRITDAAHCNTVHHIVRSHDLHYLHRFGGHPQACSARADRAYSPLQGCRTICTCC